MLSWSRREILAAIGGAGAVGLTGGGAAPYRAIAYDGFALFDPRPVASLAGSLFPAKGAELVNVWRTKQFDYQWLRALSGHYQDFWRVTESALLFAARSLQLDLRPEARDALMGAWLELKAWPDVPPALRALKQAGLRQAPLANLTREILDAAIRASGLGGVFDAVLSTDAARTFKPDPRAYQLGVDALALAKQQIVFVPSAGWDAAGARWFGYPTYWINRSHAPADELGADVDATSDGMPGLIAFTAANKRSQ